MKKEYLIVAAIGFILLSYVLDYLAGSVSINVSSSQAFLEQVWLTRYPLTAVEIGLRAVGLAIAVVVILDSLEERYSIKTIVVFVIGILAQFYAIQQLTSGGRLTPIQWTLALSYGGTLLMVFVPYFILRGVLRLFGKVLGGNKNQKKVHESHESGSDTLTPPGMKE